MTSIYRTRRIAKYLFVLFAILIAGISIIITQILVNKLAKEEKARIELWTDATRELVRTDNTDCDLNFVQKVIESNHTIPVMLIDNESKILFHRNIKIKDEDSKKLQSLKEKFAAAHTPIEVQLNDKEKQYILYNDSELLTQLAYFPFIQIIVITLFLFLSFYAFFALQKAEQNKVWIGLSRETAHQLGTPISSLLAWKEILKTRYPSDTSLSEMGKDIERLSTIAERFSKIGSQPELESVSIHEILTQSVSYIQKRSSKKVVFSIEENNKTSNIRLNQHLFNWVIENLCKNAIDAMDGIGRITLTLSETEKNFILDISDTGKGIVKSKQKIIFSPGYTTKKRGWGLGLSLTKRIIEEYHKGKIFVKSSEINNGTVFRIILKK